MLSNKSKKPQSVPWTDIVPAADPDHRLHKKYLAWLSKYKEDTKDVYDLTKGVVYKGEV